MSRPIFQPDEMRWAQDIEDRLKRLERGVAATWRSIGSATTDVAPFQNGWTNYGGGYNLAGFLLDANGFIHLRGLIKSGTIGQAAFTIPPGFRPEYDQLFGTVSNSAIGRVDVTRAGLVIPSVGSNAWISLDGLIFRAYQ